MEKLEPLYISGGSIEWFIHFGKQFISSSKSGMKNVCVCMCVCVCVCVCMCVCVCVYIYIYIISSDSLKKLNIALISKPS